MKKKTTKSVGAIILNSKNQILLVFQRKGQFWEFPKGTVEPKETVTQTLEREIREETGISQYQKIFGFRKKIFYRFEDQGTVVDKQVTFFLISTNQLVKMSHEHEKYKWVSFAGAKQLVRHKNHINLIDQVADFLQKT